MNSNRLKQLRCRFWPSPADFRGEVIDTMQSGDLDSGAVDLLHSFVTTWERIRAFCRRTLFSSPCGHTASEKSGAFSNEEENEVGISDDQPSDEVGFTPEKVSSLMRVLTRGTSFKTITWGSFDDDGPPGERSGNVILVCKTSRNPMDKNPVPSFYTMTVDWLAKGKPTDQELIVNWKLNGELIGISRPIIQHQDPEDPRKCIVTGFEKIYPSNEPEKMKNGVDLAHSILARFCKGENRILMVSSSAPEYGLAKIR